MVAPLSMESPSGGGDTPQQQQQLAGRDKDKVLFEKLIMHFNYILAY